MLGGVWDERGEADFRYLDADDQFAAVFAVPCSPHTAPIDKRQLARHKY